MKRGKRIFGRLLVLFGVMCIICYGISQYDEWKESHSGIPDVVSSISRDRSCHLTVVANSSGIDDKEAFAREVVQMCRQNSVRSVKFSTDMNGYPSELDITVYLNRKCVERNEPSCTIEFCTKERTEDYDINNNAAQFQLYVDGKEVAFY